MRNVPIDSMQIIMRFRSTLQRRLGGLLSSSGASLGLAETSGQEVPKCPDPCQIASYDRCADKPHGQCNASSPGIPTHPVTAATFLVLNEFQIDVEIFLTKTSLRQLPECFLKTRAQTRHPVPIAEEEPLILVVDIGFSPIDEVS